MGMKTTMNNKTEFQEIICKEITLRKFYNLVVRLMNKNGVEPFFDWDDFKRWNGQIHDYSKNEFGTFKFITEWDEYNSSFVYYLDEPAN
jgi:hypothetical protein